MSIFSGLTRGGARGGKDQFDWEEVKADKDRENYLGKRSPCLSYLGPLYNYIT